MPFEELGELVDSNDITPDVNRLRQRLDDDGYLFFRGLLDADQLLSLRREMLTVMQRGGWLIAGTDPMDGIADPAARSTEGDPEYTDVYHEVYKLQAFHEIGHNVRLISLLEQIRGCPMMSQPQKVARLWFPQFTNHTTPVHQDFVHFQGSFDNLTCPAISALPKSIIRPPSNPAALTDSSLTSSAPTSSLPISRLTVPTLASQPLSSAASP